METFLKFEGEVDSNGQLWDIKLEQISCLTAGTNPFNIVKKDYTPKMKDKFFFLPGVNIPRVKLKEFALDYHIKTVRDFTEADVVFGSKLSNSKVVTRSWSYQVSTEKFIACFEGLVELKKLDDITIERVKTALEFYTQPVIISDYRSLSMMGDDGLYRNLLVNPAYEFNNSKNSTYTYEVEEEYLELVKFLDGKEIIDEGALLKHINGDDAVLVNKEVFEQLAAMLESSDTDNHVLAMEIMANCKLNESLFYILKLMGSYNARLRDCRSINHVNFKSLLSYLGIDKHRMGFSTDEKIQKLMEKGVLTPGMLNALIRDELSNPSAFYSNMVQIKTLTVSEEIAKYLNKNYEYRLTEDFVPEPEVSEPEPVLEANQGPTWI
jgi:ribosome-associated protein YbcJ (S4-like RNA binding protein)